MSVSEQCNHILMLPRWVPETPGPDEAQVRPESQQQSGPGGEQSHQDWVRPRSPGPCEVQVATTLTRSRRGPGGDQRHDVHEKLETLQPPGPHDVHVGMKITSYR